MVRLNRKIIVGSLAILVMVMIVVSLPSCRHFLFYAIDASRRSVTDPPRGQFLFEDDQVRIETGEYKRVVLGGHADNDTYRHFIRQYLFQRDGVNVEAIRFELDPHWDDFYVRVVYKAEGRRTLSALKSVKDYFYPNGQVPYAELPDGYLLVSPPPDPEPE